MGTSTQAHLAHIHAHPHSHSHTQTLHTHTHARTDARTHGRTHAHTRARAHTHTHTNGTHTHTHTHTSTARARARTHTRSGSNIGAKGAASLSAALPMFTTIRSLDIGCLCIPDASRPRRDPTRVASCPAVPSLPPSCPVQADQIDYVGPARFSSVPSPSRWRTLLTSVQFLSFSRFVETKKNSAPFSKSD